MYPIGHNDEITPGLWHQEEIRQIKAANVKAALAVPINENSNDNNGPQDGLDCVIVNFPSLLSI